MHEVPAHAHAADPVPGEERLRPTIRYLSTLLGDALVRHEGQHLLDLVEEVRLLVRSDQSAAAERLTSVDVETATLLARAFSVYFDLANIAEQVERSRDIAIARRDRGGPIRRVAEAVAAADVPEESVAALASKLAVRPVFTAHPTEAARRSVLTKLRRMADVMLDDTLDDDVRMQRAAEVVDLLWQTDEIRLQQPQVIDEARNALYYVDDLTRGPLEAVLDDLAQAFRRMGADLPPQARPVPFGAWIGGESGTSRVDRCRPRSAAGLRWPIPSDQRRGTRPAEVDNHPQATRTDPRSPALGSLP